METNNTQTDEIIIERSSPIPIPVKTGVPNYIKKHQRKRVKKTKVKVHSKDCTCESHKH